MKAKIEALGYKTQWTDVNVNRYEGYSSNMTDYHMHEYFEISFIESGNVTLILPDRTVTTNKPQLLLIGPHTPHYIYCKADDVLYSRINVLFDGNYISRFTADTETSTVFSPDGNIIPLDDIKCKRLSEIIDYLENEQNSYRKRLCLLYLLSVIKDCEECSGTLSQSLPKYITDILSYITLNYHEKINAADLAWTAGISRTSLFTNFKKYVGVGFYDYLTQCRLNHAIIELKQGSSEETVAESCGFGSSGNLIRCFNRYYGLSPKQYIKNH